MIKTHLHLYSFITIIIFIVNCFILAVLFKILILRIAIEIRNYDLYKKKILDPKLITIYK